jgi:hypothetical protein
MQLQIVGLSELELLELGEECPECDVKALPKAAAPSGEHGDLGLTAATVFLSAAAIHGLSVWLAKRRKVDERVMDASFEQLPDGTVRLHVLQTSRGQLSESPDAKVVAALGAKLQDFAKLTQGGPTS